MASGMGDRLESTVADAARISRVPQRTIREWCAQERLTYRWVRGRMLVNLAEVVELATMRRVSGKRLPRLPKEQSRGVD